jgi:hypothetical protein
MGYRWKITLSTDGAASKTDVPARANIVPCAASLHLAALALK